MIWRFLKIYFIIENTYSFYFALKELKNISFLPIYGNFTVRSYFEAFYIEKSSSTCEERDSLLIRKYNHIQSTTFQNLRPVDSI